jgi:hypothetical protein
LDQWGSCGDSGRKEEREKDVETICMHVGLEKYKATPGEGWAYLQSKPVLVPLTPLIFVK